MLRKMFLLALSLSLLVLAPGVMAQGGCAGSSHLVVTGDTLSRIGERYGISVDSLAAANNIANPDLIYIAQELCIPNAGQGGAGFGTGGSTSAPADAAPANTAPADGSVRKEPLSNRSQMSSGQGGGGVASTAYDVHVDSSVQWVSGGRMEVRIADSVMTVVPAGTLDEETFETTTMDVGINGVNNLFYVWVDNMIPLSYATIYVSAELGDRSGGALATLRVDKEGHAEGWVKLPMLYPVSRQYVMARDWDGRQSWGFFNVSMERFNQ